MNGIRSTVLVSILVGSMPCAVTVMMPVPDVTMAATYLEALPLDSQPNEFAAGNATDDADR